MHPINKNSELICSTSSHGDCFAVCTPDGVIKFYDTLSSNLKQEYSPSTHLQSNCSCLSWSKLYNKSCLAKDSNTISVKQKKIKTSEILKNKDIEKELGNLNLIAIGTSQGSILLYSLTKGSLYCHLIDTGHVEKINDIIWCSLDQDCLYSCSDDGYIIEWSITDSKIKSKWKASKNTISSISIDPSEKYLVSTSKTITVWDITTKTKLKTFTGHSQDIIKLDFINTNQPENNLQNMAYFFSAASNDRIINAWSLNLSSPINSSNSALKSFILNDGPVYLETLTIRKKSNNFAALILALSQNGQLFLFYDDLIYQDEKQIINNNNINKPDRAQKSLKIETKEGSPLKIHAAFLTNSKNERLNTIDLSQKDEKKQSEFYDSLSDCYIYLVYGSHISPVIEKIKFSELNETKKIIRRDNPFKTTVNLQTQNTKIETPLISKDLKILVSGNITSQSSNLINLNNSNQSNKRKTNEPSQMTLEERLNIMGLDSVSTDINSTDSYFKNGRVPKTDNLLVLLIQGLQSNDAKMLNHVLQHQNEKVITKTVRSLPKNYTIKLINELSKRLQGHAQSGLGLIKWLKSTLMIHTSYLMSHPDLIESLESVYEIMNVRTKLFPQLSKLQGKLQLVMSQVTSQAEGLPVGNVKEALLYYQDSTSEDEQIEDELIPSHSEFDEYIFSEDEEEDESNHEEDINELEKQASKKTKDTPKSNHTLKTSFSKKKNNDLEDYEEED